MRRVGLSLVVATLSGCLGLAGELPDDQVSYDFHTTVLVLTEQPQRGRQLSLNLEITSHSSTLVTTDVLIQVVSPLGKIIHTDTWSAVVFRPEEVWNLTQGFVTATDDDGPLRIEIVVLDHATGEELWREPSAMLVQML